MQILGVPSNLFEAEGSPFTLSSLVNNAPANSSLPWTITDGTRPGQFAGHGLEFHLHAARYRVVHRHAEPARRKRQPRSPSTSQQLIGIGVAPVASIAGGPERRDQPRGDRAELLRLRV